MCPWMLTAALIHNSPKLEAIQMSTSWLMDKQIVIYLYYGMLLSNYKEQNINTYNMDEPQKYFVKLKTANTNI